MNLQKSDYFLMEKSKYFPQDSHHYLKEHLSHLSDDELLGVMMEDYRDPIMMLIISIFVGGLGIDRLLLKQNGLFALKLITCGGLGIWALVDLFLIMSATKEYNVNRILPHLK